MKSLIKSSVAITLSTAIAAPVAIAGGLTADQLAEERANLHADGSLPFVHSVEIYGKSAKDVMYTNERADELENLYADGSLPFIHSPVIYGDSAVASDEIWTDKQLADFRNLRSDGSLL